MTDKTYLRSWHLPYVSDSPNYRYYAGTTLLTKSSIPMGSVFVMDDRPRGPPTKFEVDFLGVTVCNVMEYLNRSGLGRQEFEVYTNWLR